VLLGGFEGVIWRVALRVILGPQKKGWVFEGVILRANLGVVLGQEGGAIGGFLRV